MFEAPVHQFHIPVLGIAYSIDTPVKVARYGISSVVSILEDELMEDLRTYYSLNNNIPFKPITKKEEDYRAHRIAEYLNVLQVILDRQIVEVKSSPFSPDSEITKYFLLLPDDSPLRNKFLDMQEMTEGEEKQKVQQELRDAVVPGEIDVNIMAKVDNPRFTKDGQRMPDEFCDAMSALRGFASSNLSSSLVFSAGYNPRLYAYTEQFEDFFPNENGRLKKRIILKVSDYRSALIQGKILAKRGIWVSEFRIESGLNCGGHAFATDGLLMGPILEEFKNHRKALTEELFVLCNQGLEAKGRKPFSTIPIQKITAQGGIGNFKEQEFLLSYYDLDGTGWGSPFLLVPESTNVDEETLNNLANASKDDYYLSESSPLGVPFNNFRKAQSDVLRLERLAKNRPGSPCYRNYLSYNTEYTEIPICTSSRQYQHFKVKELKESGMSETELKSAIEKIALKDCLCEGLTASVRVKNGLKIPHNLSATSICPGPNLAYFSGIFSLKQMVDHIYGRTNINNNLDRAHMFVNELELYIEYLKKQIANSIEAMTEKQLNSFNKFKANLQAGINYYRTTIPQICQDNITAAKLALLETQLSKVLA